MTTTSPGQSITIYNEIDAAELLQKALANELKDHALELSFGDWPSVQLVLKGDGYSSTITAETAEAIVELQRAVDRTFARFVKGKTTANSLSKEERERLAFKAKVEDGSSLITINLDDAFSALAQNLAGKMTGTELVIAIASAALIWGGSSSLKAWLKLRAERQNRVTDMQERVALSEQETRRLELVTTAQSQSQVLRDVEADAASVREKFLRAGPDAKTVQFQGIRLTGEEARSLARDPREVAQEVQLNGVYVIGGLDWKKDETVRMDLRSVESQGMSFSASLATRSLMPKDKALLQRAEWDRKPVYMSVNARVRKGEVVDAVIVGVDMPRLNEG